MFFVLLADGGIIDIFTVVVLWAEACPVGCFEGGAATAAALHGADQPVLGPRFRFRVLLDGTLAPLHPAPLFHQLQLFFLLHLLLIFPAVAGPIRGAHELGALILDVPVVFVLLPRHRPQWLPLVVDALLHRHTLPPLALFSPLAGPPHTDNDTEDPENAQDDAQHGHQVVCVKRESSQTRQSGIHAKGEEIYDKKNDIGYWTIVMVDSGDFDWPALDISFSFHVSCITFQ